MIHTTFNGNLDETNVGLPVVDTIPLHSYIFYRMQFMVIILHVISITFFIYLRDDWNTAIFYVKPT